MKKMLVALILLGCLKNSFSQHRVGNIEVVFPSVVFIKAVKTHTQKNADGTDWEVLLKDPKTNSIKPSLYIESGTGFFVTKEVNQYLVTAEHIARNSLAESIVVVSLDSTNAAFEFPLKNIVDPSFIEGGKLKWITHSNADVAVIPINHDFNFFIGIPFETILNRLESPLRQRDLIVYGYPLGLGTGRRISPISKKYNPASGLIELNRFDNGQPSTFFLIDDPSISGLSGGPVIAIPQVLEFENDKALKVSGHFLLGLVHGTITKDGGGYGAIAPTKFIVETLDSAPGFNGRFEYKYPNGNLWSIVVYINGDSWDVISNLDKNGISQEKGTLKNGNGTRFIYNENSHLRFVRHYLNGKLIKVDVKE